MLIKKINEGDDFSIWQVQAYYAFQPLTAYLSVNYLDRFLDSRDLPVRLLFYLISSLGFRD